MDKLEEIIAEKRMAIKHLISQLKPMNLRI